MLAGKQCIDRDLTSSVSGERLGEKVHGDGGSTPVGHLGVDATADGAHAVGARKGKASAVDLLEKRIALLVTGLQV